MNKNCVFIMLVISINCENSSYLFVVRWYIYSNALHLKNVCTIDVVSMTMENLTLQTFTSFTLEEYSPIQGVRSIKCVL